MENIKVKAYFEHRTSCKVESSTDDRISCYYYFAYAKGQKIGSILGFWSFIYISQEDVAKNYYRENREVN